eukprot:6025444-Prymnesium_polylepis.1
MLLSPAVTATGPVMCTFARSFLRHWTLPCARPTTGLHHLAGSRLSSPLQLRSVSHRAVAGVRMCAGGWGARAERVTSHTVAGGWARLRAPA